MSNYSTEHLFEFWEYIGFKGDFLTSEKAFKYTNPNNMSWPSKIFGIDSNKLNFEQLNIKMKTGVLPKSIGVFKDDRTENQLLTHNFKKTSVVKGMYLKLSLDQLHEENSETIQQVTSVEGAIKFASIASKAFGYIINPKTISALLNSDAKIRLYLGNYRNEFASCGVVFLDKNNVSGIHMIGTLSEKRGLGLGKTMTNKLIFEASKNQSQKVVLVASESGERIYSKMGFVADGALHSYSVKE